MPRIQIEKRSPVLVCRLRSKHTKCPTSYNEWHDWATMMMKTHRQVRCAGCGLWAIWVRKPRVPTRRAARG